MCSRGARAAYNKPPISAPVASPSRCASASSNTTRSSSPTGLCRQLRSWGHQLLQLPLKQHLLHVQLPDSFLLEAGDLSLPGSLWLRDVRCRSSLHIMPAPVALALCPTY